MSQRAQLPHGERICNAAWNQRPILNKDGTIGLAHTIEKTHVLNDALRFLQSTFIKHPTLVHQVQHAIAHHRDSWISPRPLHDDDTHWNVKQRLSNHVEYMATQSTHMHTKVYPVMVAIKAIQPQTIQIALENLDG